MKQIANINFNVIFLYH